MLRLELISDLASRLANKLDGFHQSQLEKPVIFEVCSFALLNKFLRKLGCITHMQQM